MKGEEETYDEHLILGHGRRPELLAVPRALLAALAFELGCCRRLARLREHALVPLLEPQQRTPVHALSRRRSQLVRRSERGARERTSSPSRSVNFFGRYRSVQSEVSSGAKNSSNTTFVLASQRLISVRLARAQHRKSNSLVRLGALLRRGLPRLDLLHHIVIRHVEHRLAQLRERLGRLPLLLRSLDRAAVDPRAAAEGDLAPVEGRRRDRGNLARPAAEVDAREVWEDARGTGGAASWLGC